MAERRVDGLGCAPGLPGARSRVATALPGRLAREAWRREDLFGSIWARVGLARLTVRRARRGVVRGRTVRRSRAREACCAQIDADPGSSEAAVG